MIVTYRFDAATVNLLLEGLDQLPHGRVRYVHEAMRAGLEREQEAARQAQEEAAKAAKRRKKPEAA